MSNDVFAIIKLAQRLLSNGCKNPSDLTDAVHAGDWETVKELADVDDDEFKKMCSELGVEIDG